MLDDKDSPGQVPASSWNYRVLEFNVDGQTWRAIHEVYYRDGVPAGYTEDPAVVMWDANDGEEEGGLRVIRRMQEALAKPVLSEKDFRKNPGSTDGTS